MGVNRCYIGEIGTDIILNLGEDITGATGRTIEVKKPDNTTDSWAASIYNSNYLKYTIQSGDFDQAGVYIFQAALTLSGWTGLGDAVKLTVYSLFDV